MKVWNGLLELIKRVRRSVVDSAVDLLTRLGWQKPVEEADNGGEVQGPAGQPILQALGDEFSELSDILSQFFNSDWAFGLTQSGAWRRRMFFTIIGALWWAYDGYLTKPPAWDVAASIIFVRGILRALFDPRILLLFIVLGALFWLLLFFAYRLLAGSALANRLRLLSFGLPALVGALWGFLASRLISDDLPIDFVREFVAYPFEALFAPQVFRHVLVAAMAFWIAYRIASTYLEDIYELNDIGVAERFILQAAFASQYNVIQILAGDVVKEHHRSPIFRIGGPGLVQVHYDSAALFESVDGEPRVIGPTVYNGGHVETLSGFERLRKPLKLYDHIEEKFPVEGRTRDGLRIRLKDVNIVYSIYRAEQEASMTHPYPFEREAVQNLVYNQGPNPLETAMRSMIRREFTGFISRHTMNEFLASIGTQEVEDHQQKEASLAEEVNDFSGLPVSAEGILREPGFSFHTRPDIMTELFAEEFDRRAAERGVEIRWIGGGTWDPVDTIVLEKHQEAWRLSRQNLMRGNVRALERLRIEHGLFEKLRLVQEIPIRIFRENQADSSTNLMLKLLVAYRHILNQAYAAHQRNPQDPAQQIWLRQVLEYLSYFTARWLGGA
ncbi:MAG: hypothetical protein JSV61_05955 [Anaerolineales bacterium]|nr:MAG: hypothetical protein JSV61_05955 [Anaerolineales bacterium]